MSLVDWSRKEIVLATGTRNLLSDEGRRNHNRREAKSQSEGGKIRHFLLLEFDCWHERVFVKIAI